MKCPRMSTPSTQSGNTQHSDRAEDVDTQGHFINLQHVHISRTYIHTYIHSLIQIQYIQTPVEAMNGNGFLYIIPGYQLYFFDIQLWFYCAIKSLLKSQWMN